MSAYIVAHVDVKNVDAYREYMRHTPRVIQKYGGRFIVRGGEMVTLEGPEETLRLVVIEFPSMDQAKAFYGSADYTRVRRLREGGGIAKLVAIDGYPAEKWQEVSRESAKLELPS
jgi:uncharacterized protein (DUF1330 family)